MGRAIEDVNVEVHDRVTGQHANSLNFLNASAFPGIVHGIVGVFGDAINFSYLSL